MKISAIYKIQSKIKPERIYIGSAVSINNRWRNHINGLKNNKHPNNKLQNHFNKYGEADLQFSIILGCDKDYLVVNEQFFIDSYKPFFNISPTAGSCLGVKQSRESNQKRREALLGEKNHNYGKSFSKETKQKLSFAHKGKKRGALSNETKRKLSIANIGKHICSDEYRKKLSDSAKNKPPITEETKRKISISHKGLNTWQKGKPSPNKGNHLSDESKQKISKSNLGKKLSKETCKKISESHKGKEVSIETRLKISLANKGNKSRLGQKNSEETKSKMKEAWVLRKNKVA